ncbi:DNA polymerase II [Candidatus Woesearchaeota archaeon]|nr:DNA polymerase II [Candidatus Woesearchaeota archaeon]
MLRGFVTYPTYKLEDDGAYVYLFGRLENGESFLTKNKSDPYFFIKKKDGKKAEKLEEFPEIVKRIEKTNYRDFQGNNVIKIVLNNPKEVPRLRKKLEEEKVTCYEADIRFAYRFLMDKEIKGSLSIEGKYEKGKYVQRVYEEPVIKSATWEPKLKVLSIDIETNPDTTDIYSIALHTKSMKKALFVGKKGGYAHAVVYDTEEKALREFIREVQEIDPDIITGWNVIDFDLKIIYEKCKRYKIPFLVGRWEEPGTLRIENSFFIDSKADFQGRIVLDGIHVLKGSFVKLEDYKLNTAAKKFTNEEKLIDETKDKYKEIKRMYEKDQQRLIDYNIKDALLVENILENSKTLALTIQRSLLTGMPLDRVNASIASLDFVYMIEARKRGLVLPSLDHHHKEHKTTGGYVKSTKPGIYDYVMVFDFKSLYPSIIRTFNIDPASYQPDSKKGDIKAPNGAVFKAEEGVLPHIIQRLTQEREKAKKEKNELARYAIKILMNSFYGVMASPNCRFYSPEIANAITHFGQYLIKLTSRKIEEEGYEVIYNDTDSVFVKSKAKDASEAARKGEKIQKDINMFYDKLIKDTYNRKNALELEFEKVYKKIILPKQRHAEAGAKKRYAGILVKGKQEKLEFVGLEFVRSDWTKLARKFQQELYERIFREEDPQTYINQVVKDLQNGKYDDLLIYRKSIRKDVAEYTKTTPPHIKAARKLDKIESTVIEYYMTEKGPEPVQKRKGKIDYKHYIEKQIKPIADSILVFFGRTFEDVIKGDKQFLLGDFRK